MGGCRSGVSGARDLLYVAYISSRKITGQVCFRRPPRQVCARPDVFVYSRRVCHEHRGIFRNPLSFFTRSHPGMALMLHSFVGTFMHQLHASEFMVVNPDLNLYMMRLLLQEFEPDACKIPQSIEKFGRGRRETATVETMRRTVTSS